MAKYKCKVCGYIHEGNKAPDVCPVCAAPASDFEEMKGLIPILTASSGSLAC